MSLSLLIVDPEGTAKQWPLRPGPIRVGRGQKNDLIIVGRGVSRNHAILRLEGDQLHVEDQDSTYGTKVNGRQMRKAQVTVGDHIDIGVFRLVVVPEVEHIEVAPAGAPVLPLDTVAEPAHPTGKWDEPTVGILTTGEFELTNPRISASEIFRPRGYPTPDEQPKMRRLREAQEQKSDPFLGVRFVTGRVDFHEPLSGSADNAPVVTRMEDLARQLREQSGTDSASNSAALSALLIVHRVADRMARAENLGAFVDETLDMLAQHLAVTTAVLVRRDEVGKLRAVSVRHLDPIKRDEIPVSRSVIDQALSTGRPLQSTDLQSDPEFGHRESVMAYKVGALLAVPLMVREQPVGVLCLSRRAGRPFNRVETETVLGVGSLLARAVSLRDLERDGDRERRRRKLLERFHSPELVERIYQRHGRLGLATEEATALFFELTHFHRLVARDGAKRAGELAEALRSTAHEAVFGNGGSLVWMHEDAGLAVFGGQGTAESDAAWALAAAGELLREFGNLARDFDLTRITALRVGLDRGDLMTGLLGPRDRLHFSCLGIPVSNAQDAARVGMANAVHATSAVLDQIPNPRGQVIRLEPSHTGLDQIIFEITS